VVWEATAKTTGTVRVGWLDEKFADSLYPSFSSPNWDVAICWSPLAYSHFDLSTKRSAESPVNLLGLVTDAAVYSLAGVTNGVAAWSRRNKTPQYSLALIYKMQLLRWEAGLNINAPDSPLASYNDNQSITRLGARITF
jgi:hypothetical protein